MADRTARARVDWHRVFDDFAYLGMTGDELADRIGLRAGLLQRIATGAQVRTPGAAQRICNLWAHLTGKPLEFIHRTEEAEGAPQPEVPGIDSNQERGPSYDLQAAMYAWYQPEHRK